MEFRCYLVYKPRYGLVPVWWPPSWISDFQLRRTVSSVTSLDSPYSKTWVWSLEFFFYLVYKLRYECLQFRAAILDFRLPVPCDTVPDSTVEKFDPQNMEVAVEIWFLSGLQAEIHLGGTFTPSPLGLYGCKITLGTRGLTIRSSAWLHWSQVRRLMHL